MSICRPVVTPLILATVVTLITGCGGSSSAPPPATIDDGDVVGSNFFISANNSARLSGPVLGDGSMDNADLRKSISFTLSEPSSDIEINKVYATRLSDTRSSLIVVIDNISNSTQCFISLEGSVLAGADGADLGFQFSSSSIFADSSIGVSSLYTNTCLTPGERGYATTFGDFTLADITAVSFDSIDTSSSNWTSAEEIVLPLSYAINDTNIEVVVANQSSITIVVSDLNYVVLDDQGFPLKEDDIFFFPAEILQPGEEFTFSDELEFEGMASTVRVILDFDPESPAP